MSVSKLIVVLIGMAMIGFVGYNYLSPLTQDNTDDMAQVFGTSSIDLTTVAANNKCFRRDTSGNALGLKYTFHGSTDTYDAWCIGQYTCCRQKCSEVFGKNNGNWVLDGSTADKATQGSWGSTRYWTCECNVPYPRPGVTVGSTTCGL